MRFSKTLLFGGAILGVNLFLVGVVSTLGVAAGERRQESTPTTSSYPGFYELQRSLDLEQSLLGQSEEAAEAKSRGCMASGCHMGIEKMHTSETVRLGCTDCHGGNASATEEDVAHVLPGDNETFVGSANPVRVATAWTKERAEFIRFANPGDLRVLDKTCGSAGCHVEQTLNVRKSMMTTGGVLWGAALYNNGAYPLKDTHFGESYGPDGTAQRVQTVPAPTASDIAERGILEYLDPLPQWGISQPGNVLRVFERGGKRAIESGNPDPEEEPGRPDKGLSVRGFGTGNRTDPVFLGLQKTRLMDPLLHFPGTNDQPGDYWASGCTACHVVYANDRSADHSGPYAGFGNRGYSASRDESIPKEESGHPITHQLTLSIPSSQCISCHMHPGTNMETPYLGYTWWDNETDGDLMYPKASRELTAAERDLIQRSNPEGSALKGNWSDPEFLAEVSSLNPDLEKTQFADFHGHGWIYRAVFSQDRKGNLLDSDGNIISWEDPERFEKAVHLKDIHLEKGMHCVDCHFEQDVHGDGNLYNEPRAGVEIDCVDCHGEINQPATLRTSSFAAPEGGNSLEAMRTPWGKRRFERRGNLVLQRSMVDPELTWEVSQIIDTITPGSASYNEKAHLAKTIQKDGETWGTLADETELAHANSSMTCYACHSSWVTSCFGCHLSMTANEEKPMLHYEGEVTENWTSYNYQVIRDDVYMLGVDGTVTGNRIAPARSSSAVVVSSQNKNREWLYRTQQTISAEGYSGQAFATNVPHTVRTTETKTCTDCHLSVSDDNNAIMAQLLMQGTNFVNFMGGYAYVGTGEEGIEAVAITEKDEPMAVVGSYLHGLAYPEEYQQHEEKDHLLETAYHHHSEDARSVLLRGEYLYVADGPAGLRIFDVAQIDHKGFSERIVSAPVSPLGQRFSVDSEYATAVAAPSTLALDPARIQRPENDEQPIAPIYGYILFTDLEEGLILVGAATLLDGDPTNNFLERTPIDGQPSFNPDGLLDGAISLTIAGNFVYVGCDRGLVILDLADPQNPQIAAIIEADLIPEPRSIAVQFRYAFVADSEGLKVVDVTDPYQPRFVSEASYQIPDARNVYVARTYAYVAAGAEGLVILDVERPENPDLLMKYNAGGEINDAHDVKVAMTNASLFAYVADGENGLRVLQLTSPDRTPGNFGYSPAPDPALIATYHTHGPALAVSKGLDRDRAVDESGNQTAVFGRRGARPMNLEEMQKLYLRAGEIYKVRDDPPGPAVN